MLLDIVFFVVPVLLILVAGLVHHFAPYHWYDTVGARKKIRRDAPRSARLLFWCAAVSPVVTISYYLLINAGRI